MIRKCILKQKIVYPESASSHCQQPLILIDCLSPSVDKNILLQLRKNHYLGNELNYVVVHEKVSSKYSIFRTMYSS